MTECIGKEGEERSVGKCEKGLKKKIYNSGWGPLWGLKRSSGGNVEGGCGGNLYLCGTFLGNRDERGDMLKLPVCCLTYERGNMKEKLEQPQKCCMVGVEV